MQVSTNTILKSTSKALRHGLRVMCAAGLIALGTGEGQTQIIPGQYIAVMKRGTPNIDASAQAVARQHGLGVGAVYQHSIKGFAFRGSDRAAAALARHPLIAYVEADQLCWPCVEEPQVLPSGVDRVDVDEVGIIDGVDDWVDADIAIIDSGIDLDHPDLRVVGGRHFYPGHPSWKIRSDDNYGEVGFHGTYVAGIAAAIDNDIGVVGVAPGARLWAIRAFEGAWEPTPTSIVIAALDWVTANASVFEVVNLSLGGGYSQAANDAVRRAVEAGIVVVVSAGNDADDVAGYSPASEPTALTVSAMRDYNGVPDYLDVFAYYSNYGELVDVCAPGSPSLSTDPDGAYMRMGEGTSWAAPHVSGAAALYIAVYGMEKSLGGVLQVGDAIQSTGWQLGDPEYLAGEDPDALPEPLLNVGALVSVEPPTGGACVADLDGASTALGNKWVATVQVLVTDLEGVPVSNAMVNGIWSGGTSGGASAVTEIDGLAMMTSGAMLAKKAPSATFTVTGVTCDDLTYQPHYNSDPDGDSDGTTITISRP